MRKALARFVWVAITPLAVLVLSSTQVRGDAVAEPHETATVSEDHHGGGHHGPVIQNWVDPGYKAKHLPAPFAAAWLNFAAFAAILLKLIGPGLARMARERHDVLAKALAEGQRLRDEAQAKLDEYSKRLAQLDEELATLADGIRKDAEADKARIISEAEARAVRIQKDAEQQIDAEIAKVKGQLEREAVAAAVAVAEQILREKTTDADQKQMADRFVASISKAQAAPKA
jgi:F-type H+-transporting ATPase subunit b